MYEAFGWTPPEFAHVGLLLNKDRQKLSKRLESMSIADLRDKGVFPETVTNFVALLGWSHKFGNDAMSLEDLVRNVRIPHFAALPPLIAFLGKPEIHTRRHNSRFRQTLVPPKTTCGTLCLLTTFLQPISQPQRTSLKARHQTS